jgi:glycosyltransferase involved in cell wall biosynthesis
VKKLWHNDGPPVKIAQVCTPFISVPPRGYGGVERVVSYLTEALVSRGHQVTLFASGDSRSRADIVSPALHASGIGPDGKMLYLVTLAAVLASENEFDVVHFHFTDWTMLPFVKALRARCLVTFHMPIEMSAATSGAFLAYADVALVSLSNAQRRSGIGLNWQKTIYNGLPTDLYSIQEKPNGYYAFIGRLGPSKGPDLAIDIATEARVRLKLAGPIQQPYFDQKIAPRLKLGEIEYVGELDDAAKQSFLGGANALLFPTQVEEAFGLVMIEAMACGTPVVAFDRGATREVITDGINGFVVSGVKEAAGRLNDASNLCRVRCRAEFDGRFSASRMCLDYCEVYGRLAVETFPRPSVRTTLPSPSPT